MRILLVEDEYEDAKFISAGLTEAAHTVDTVSTGADGLILAMKDDYDVVILDRKLPDLDGLSIAKLLRSGGRKIPILFLTCLGSVKDRVEGLEEGGDDYVVKPFAFSELLARVNALGRRPPMLSSHETLRCGDLEMNVTYRSVMRSGERIDLLPLEYKLLEALLRNMQRVVSKTMLLERVWGFNFDPKTSVVETHISRLRSKIDKPFKSQLIHTVRGSGYSIYEE
ncbi:response regulator transcription factor [Methyloceanibacter sp.]|uniref:winged helix-turn-helix domain-containing protein n=1 Tax=Methyloceanibacter sp. TaxID=1965321 RepID=UPI002087463E|nr:response regulator transcription factor [Methyloceanibacter sp.]GFO82817.1 MAG: DNA-binding response regulator [Methyloceanibacter sp.]HML91083.1 response regulator transcription factor [Methyloceanibacter sp.]